MDLMGVLPAERHPALQQELNLLDQMLEKSYILPQDRHWCESRTRKDLVRELVSDNSFTATEYT